MAATFGSLNLEELGILGEPEVQYAKFETEVSEPRGYDGGVLANFRRGATNIKFNLALTGTKSEITNKLNTLAAELAKGQQELVLPTMTPGFHFDASANCTLAPAQYIDGFVLPLEFTVPDGMAYKEDAYTVGIGSGKVIYDIELPSWWSVEATAMQQVTIQGTGVSHPVSESFLLIGQGALDPYYAKKNAAIGTKPIYRGESVTIDEGVKLTIDVQTLSVQADPGPSECIVREYRAGQIIGPLEPEPGRNTLVSILAAGITETAAAVAAAFPELTIRVFRASVW